MSHLIIGTAGHVDHGKTSLIRRLTGIETDRLKEEKERGLSIDIGFAYFVLPSGRTAGIVDVPGHERFIKNMLAGAYGMDLVLLVIAADEGVMPQTVEHLTILQLLEVRNGLVVLTKIDRVEPDWLQLVEDEVRQQLMGTFLAEAPVVKVSSETGEGFDSLVSAIDSLCATTVTRLTAGAFRMPIDRAFTMEGFGTVVTGTTISGTLRIGDPLEILPQRLSTRARSLQVHDRDVEIVEAGQRVAINFPGISRSLVQRGDVAVTPNIFTTTDTFDSKLILLRSAHGPLKDGSPVRLHIGAGEYLPRVFLLGAKKVEPGETCYARIRFDDPVPAAMHDRFVVRSYSPMRTIGGGVVLDIRPVHARKFHTTICRELDQIDRADPLATAETLLRRAGMAGVSRIELSQWMSVHPDEADELLQRCHAGKTARLGQKTGRWIHRDTYQQLMDATVHCLSEFHTSEPLQHGMTRDLLREAIGAIMNAGQAGLATTVTLPSEVFDSLMDELRTAAVVVAEKDLIRLPKHHVAMEGETKRISEAIDRLYKEAQFNPPEIAVVLTKLQSDRETTGKILYSMINSGNLVKIGELIFHKDVIKAGEQRIRDYVGKHGSMTVADFRNLIDSSRKYAVPLLEYYDKTGLTRRMGDVRILRN